MRLKEGVSVGGMGVEALLALVIAAEVYDSMGAELVVTSVKDGKHGEASLHYEGKAVDLRIHNLVPLDVPKVIEKLRKRLGREYDVVLEKDHIHVEFDPR